jgi:hypothetical protein
VVPSCKINKYNVYLETETTVLYRTELVWQGNKITHRLNYGNTLSSSAGVSLYGLMSKDSITYNANDLVEKIYYGNKGYALEKYDLFYYQVGNSKPYRRDQVRRFANGYIGRFIEDITYENNKIKETVGHYEDEPMEPIVIKEYTYNADGNLIQTIETKNQTTYTPEVIVTTDYSNYDSHINPFSSIEVPFIENRDVNYSPNNHKSVSQTTKEDNVVISYSNWEISDLQYNSLGYPMIGEYLCN